MGPLFRQFTQHIFIISTCWITTCMQLPRWHFCTSLECSFLKIHACADQEILFSFRGGGSEGYFSFQGGGWGRGGVCDVFLVILPYKLKKFVFVAPSPKICACYACHYWRILILWWFVCFTCKEKQRYWHKHTS